MKSCLMADEALFCFMRYGSALISQLFYLLCFILSLIKTYSDWTLSATVGWEEGSVVESGIGSSHTG